jgi:hypothetical protein
MVQADVFEDQIAAYVGGMRLPPEYVDEDTLTRETAPLKRTLAKEDEPREVLDVEEAIGYLRRVGELWSESPRNLQRQFVREVFQRIVVKGREVTVITPRPVYAPLFVLDRRERFGALVADSCILAPRAGLEPTVLHPVHQLPQR